MDLTELAKGYYRAYERHDRAFIENNLAPGFTFTSPFDDHIGREEYFRRCWPTTAPPPEVRLRDRDAGGRQGVRRL